MMFRGKVRTVHFVGIGGIGMSGIAEVLLTLGFAVTGSDLSEGASVLRLRKLGATVHLGHAAENVGDADVVVRSSAVSEENPEITVAQQRKIPVIRRAEMLAELMRMKYGVAVAGTHGKTTTTSMLATCLFAGGFDPTMVIGGRLDSLGGTNARLGAGDLLVAEADESDGTFLFLTPTVAVVTNVDPEHLDHYGTVEALEEAFLTFVNRVPFYGFAVLCLDHPVVQRFVPLATRRVVTYGFARQADYRPGRVELEGLTSRFDAYRGEELLGEVRLGMPGRHNVQNALGAIAASIELGVPFSEVQKALHGFTGVQRRFTIVGEAAGVMVVDDYGHHPAEIRATLAAAAEAFTGRRVVAVFQPHRYSRVHDLWTEFCGAFNDAAEVVVTPIYPAGEPPIEGVSHRGLVQDMRDRRHLSTRAVDDLDSAVEWLAANVRAGDIVITLGAGNVNAVCKALLARLEGP